MGRLIELETQEGKVVYIEAEGEEIQILGGKMERIIKHFNEITNTIEIFCGSLLTTFHNLRKKGKAPDKVTAEFGIKLNGQGDVYIVKTGAEACLKITVEWQLK